MYGKIEVKGRPEREDIQTQVTRLMCKNFFFLKDGLKKKKETLFTKVLILIPVSIITSENQE